MTADFRNGSSSFRGRSPDKRPLTADGLDGSTPARSTIGRTVAALFFVFFLISTEGCLPSSSGDLQTDLSQESGYWLVYEGILAGTDSTKSMTRLELFIDFSNPEPPFILKRRDADATDSGYPTLESGIYGTLKEYFRGTDATVFELNPDKQHQQIYFLRMHHDTLKWLQGDIRSIDAPDGQYLIRTGMIRER